nr:MAG TPA: hypothetical protein [Caudoviricetes sp.]
MIKCGSRVRFSHPLLPIMVLKVACLLDFKAFFVFKNRYLNSF